MNIQNSLTVSPGSQKLLSASFNQDQGCFTISYETGFRVYNSDPMELNVKREWDPAHHRNSRSSNSAQPGPEATQNTGGSSNNNSSNNNNNSNSSSNSNANNSINNSNSNETGGGIGLAQMLHRTNYLALVGGGRNPRFPQNKVIIWDDLKRRPALSLEFFSPVLNVLLSRTHIVVVLVAKVHVFAFSSPPTRIASYETADNSHGVAVLANNVLAFPSRLNGQIQIVNLESHANNNFAANASNLGNVSRSSAANSASNSKNINNSNTNSSSNDQANSGQYHYHTQNSNLVTIIRAHKGPIRCLALNRTGTIIASASEMGTIIRLHSTRNTALLHEFRRGLDRAVIYSMAFSPSTSQSSSSSSSASAGPGGHHQYSPLRLAVLSDKNTLHVFDASGLVGAANSAGIQPNSKSGPNANATSSHSSSTMSDNGNVSQSSGNNTNTSTAANTTHNSTIPGGVTGGAGALGSSIASGIGSFFSGMQQLNRRHVLSKLPLMPRYFYSEWSFVSARVEGLAGVLGWPSDDCVIVVWTDTCKWEKYVIVEKEHTHGEDGHHTAGSGNGGSNNSNNGNHHHHHGGSEGGSSDDNGNGDGISDKYELVREAWRGFEGVSQD